MNGRVYDYNVGRFMSVDPFIQGVGNSQGINPYSYVMNNPLWGTDPSGYTGCAASKIESVCDKTSSSQGGKDTSPRNGVANFTSKDDNGAGSWDSNLFADWQKYEFQDFGDAIEDLGKTEKQKELDDLADSIFNSEVGIVIPPESRSSFK